MKKPKKPTSSKSQNTPETKETSAEKLSGLALKEALIASERAGTLRGFLKDVSKIMRELKGDSTDEEILVRKELREWRINISYYFLSLISQFDADLKGEMIETLLYDLLRNANATNVQIAKELGVEVDIDERAADRLHLVMRHLIPNYCNIVQDGYAERLDDLPHFVFQLVELLNDIAKHNPQAIRSAAEERIDWPFMNTRNYPKPAQFGAFADKIGLATKSSVKPQARQTWKPDTPLNRYIVRMLVEECWGDQRLLSKENVLYYLDEVLMPLFERVAQEVGGWEHYPEFAQIALSAAKRGKTGTQRSEIRSRVKAALDAMAT